MRVRISFAKVMITPPARVRKPFALWEGSCDLRDRPICTTPKPSRIIPTARIKPKIKSERLLTTVIGSLAAKAVVVKQVRQSTTAAYAARAFLLFLPIGSLVVSLFWVFFLKNFIDNSSLNFELFFQVLLGQQLIGCFDRLHVHSGFHQSVVKDKGCDSLRRLAVKIGRLSSVSCQFHIGVF